MAKTIEMSPRTTRTLRIVGWTGVVVLLLLPAAAMRFTGEVDWSPSDFVFAAVMFGTAGGLLELAARASAGLAFRVGAGLAVLTGFLTLWITMAVGIIGEPDNPLNLVYFAMIGIAASGVIAAWGKPRALARAMWATAGAQALIGFAHLTGTAQPAVLIDGFFALMWLVSGVLFARAASERAAAGAD